MEKSFESQLKELEAIVGKLEDGELPLEESLHLFEQGVRLSRECRERLDTAERRIEVLLKDTDGNFTVREFDSAVSAADGDTKTVRKRIVFESEEEPPF